MAILWRKSLETGFTEIDEQHQEIFKRANQLIEINKSTEGRKEGYERARELLDFLQDYIVHHFKEEEKIQRKYDYPNYEEHKKIHDDLLQQTNELAEKFKHQEKQLTELAELNQFILNWLTKHIDQQDRKVVKYIKNNK